MKHQAVASFRCLPLVAVVAGTSGLAIGSVLPSSPPLLFAGICLLGAAILVGTVGVYLGTSLVRVGQGRPVAVGLLRMTGAIGAGLIGLQYLSPETGATIFYAMPLWLATMEWTSSRQMQSLVDVIAMTCGMLGLGLLASGIAPVTTSHDMLGLALLSMAIFNWALGMSVRRNSLGDLDPWCRAVFQLATAGAIVIIASLALERGLDWTQMPIFAWPLVLNLMIATGLAYAVWHQDLATGTAQRQNDPARAQSAIGSEHYVETSDAGCNASLSPHEDRRRGRLHRIVHRRPEPVHGPSDRFGAAGTARTCPPRLCDRPGVPPKAHKA